VRLISQPRPRPFYKAAPFAPAVQWLAADSPKSEKPSACTALAVREVCRGSLSTVSAEDRSHPSLILLIPRSTVNNPRNLRSPSNQTDRSPLASLTTSELRIIC